MIPLSHLLLVAFALFSIGAAAVVLRRNILVVLMGIELMLNAVNLSFVSFARYFDDGAGHMFVMMIFVVAAVEVAVGMAIVVNMFKLRQTISLDNLRELRA